MTDPWGPPPEGVQPTGKPAGQPGPPAREQPDGQPPPQPYGQPAPHGQAPHGQAPYGQAPYGQAPYGQAPQGYPPPGYPGYPPQGPGNNGMAIASLVLGIVWIYWLGSLLAVIFGHIALGQIKRSGQGGRGLAIAGLVLGYIGLAILVVFIIIGIGLAASADSSY